MKIYNYNETKGTSMIFQGHSSICSQNIEKIEHSKQKCFTDYLKPRHPIQNYLFSTIMPRLCRFSFVSN